MPHLQLLKQMLAQRALFGIGLLEEIAIVFIVEGTTASAFIPAGADAASAADDADDAAPPPGFGA